VNQDIPVPTPDAGRFSIHGGVGGSVQFRQNRLGFCEIKLFARAC